MSLSRDKETCPRSHGWRKLASSWDSVVVRVLVTVTKYLARSHLREEVLV